MALSKCKKLLYFISELILCVAYTLVVIITSVTVHQLNHYKSFLPLVIFGPPSLIICLNLLQAYGFWRGFIGILRGKRPLILILCACLTINVISDVIIGLWSLTINNDIRNQMNDELNQSFVKYSLKGFKKEEWNNLQYELKCCGTFGPKSFSDIGVDFVPIHCCNSSSANIECNGGFYKDGCITALTNVINEQIYYFISLVFVFVIIQILGIVLFCNLNAYFNKHSEHPIISSAPVETLLKRKSSNK